MFEYCIDTLCGIPLAVLLCVLWLKPCVRLSELKPGSAEPGITRHPPPPIQVCKVPDALVKKHLRSLNTQVALFLSVFCL
jgi:hypothetical protein